MEFKRVKIVTFAPSENADEIRATLGAAGAGTIGEYSFCSFTCSGEGRFTPTDDAQPYIGTANKPEIVTEERIEVVCDRIKAKDVIHAMKSVHPYDEVAFDIYPLLEESQL